ncbi:MAG: hypothetical protein PHN99_05980 [Eubacteriales bacterium]|jgi:uncharacterized paraquat-inducible protein A|nr:hypothetical protein [Eubacteriales bacterium]MDD4717646.1 hypothetical protein [Eubacteriales bacterium]NCU26607.1 hypothetical protein [Candidatus Nomurabacteria bacterium]
MKKKSATAYEKHIIKCPACGKDALDHMTECPSCKAKLTPLNYQPMDSSVTRKIRLVLTVVLIIAFAIFLIIKYLF